MYYYLIGLGSNLPSDTLSSKEILERALLSMPSLGINVIRVSVWWKSKAFPVGAGPNYINGVAKVSSDFTPAKILELLKEIELLYGRKRSKRWGSRKLDLDLLACGNMILPNEVIFREWLSLPKHIQLTREPKYLILPHPRIQDRLFVLKPLLEVSPNWEHPVLGKKSQDLINEIDWTPQDFLEPL